MEADEFILVERFNIQEDYAGHEKTDVGKRGVQPGLLGYVPIHPKVLLIAQSRPLCVVEAQRPAQSGPVQVLDCASRAPILRGGAAFLVARSAASVRDGSGQCGPRTSSCAPAC